MKTLTLILYLLLLGFPRRADERKVSVPDNGDKSIINVGLIVDMKLGVGKVVQSCSRMAVSDFYNLNWGYKTRVALHVRDSGGDSLPSIAAALELLENVEVQAIIIPEIPNEELFLTRLGDKVNVPLLSFSSISSSNEHPYFVQVVEDENKQFHGIAAFLQEFRWRSFVFLYEDTADARQDQTYVNDVLQNHLNVGYQTSISLQATDDQIITELHELMMMKASIILVHLSPSLASRVFKKAKILGMMSKGFGWIATSKTMNLLDAHNSSVYESMQGVVGFKSYPFASTMIQNLTCRWRRAFHQNGSNLEIRSLNVYGVWAYDALWVLAEAIERTGIELFQNWGPASGSAILRQITSSRFTGSVGKYHPANRKLIPEIYEILNIMHKGERRVGFWTSACGFIKEIIPSVNSSSNMLETIIWPGFTSTAPESRLVPMSRRSIRIGVPARGRFPELIGLNHDRQHNVTTFSGFCIDVFRAAVDRLPNKISYEYIPFYDQYGSYNNLISQVYIQKYDAAVGDITILSNRSAYVDFTLPYTELGVGVVVKLDDNDSWYFLKPLKADLRITSSCSFFLTGFIVWLIEHRTNEEFQGPVARQIGIALGFAISTLVYAHRERLQSNLSRFVVGVWLFVVLILTSSYIAKLSSLLTVEQIKLTKSDYIGYSTHSFIPGISGSNLNFKDNRLKLFQSPEDYDNVLRKGNRNGGVRAIVEELPYLKIFLARFPNEYAIVLYVYQAFPKGSPLVHDISRAITELREEGKLQQMEKKWFSSQLSLSSQDTEPPNKANPLSKENFFGLFLISGISKSIAMLMFLLILLREKLSIYCSIFTVLSRGKLMFMLRCLHDRRMANVIEGVDAR